ncbi:MAG: hypothetical protein ABEK59_01400 [Halobacteria archaeon]
MTEYRDDALYLTPDLKPKDVRQFVYKRATNPRQVAGLTIYSFNNHVLDVNAIEESREMFERDKYLIPYQVPAIWGYMYKLLPDEIREVEVLSYSSVKQEYTPFSNIDRLSREEKDVKFQHALMEEMRD